MKREKRYTVLASQLVCRLSLLIISSSNHMVLCKIHGLHHLPTYKNGPSIGRDGHKMAHLLAAFLSPSSVCQLRSLDGLCLIFYYPIFRKVNVYGFEYIWVLYKKEILWKFKKNNYLVHIQRIIRLAQIWLIINEVVGHTI